jgi:hypothetical protein
MKQTEPEGFFARDAKPSSPLRGRSPTGQHKSVTLVAPANAGAAAVSAKVSNGPLPGETTHYLTAAPCIARFADIFGNRDEDNWASAFDPLRTSLSYVNGRMTGKR